VQLLDLPTVPHSRASTPLLERLLAGDLMLGGAPLAEHGLPPPPLPPESALVIGLRRMT